MRPKPRSPEPLAFLPSVTGSPGVPTGFAREATAGKEPNALLPLRRDKQQVEDSWGMGARDVEGAPLGADAGRVAEAVQEIADVPE